MRSKLIIALFLLIGLLFPMLPEQGGRPAAPSASGRAFARTGMREAQVDRPEAEGAAARPPCSGSIGKSSPMSRKSAMISLDLITKGDLYRFCKYKTNTAKS